MFQEGTDVDCIHKNFLESLPCILTQDALKAFAKSHVNTKQLESDITRAVSAVSKRS
jgi:hypothetical protein